MSCSHYRKLLVLFVMAACRVMQGAAEPVVVVNALVTVDRIAPTDLRDIFVGEKSSLPNGARVTPILLRKGPTHDAFLTIYVGKAASAFEGGWRKMVFTGRGALPKMFDSEEAVLDYVAKTPGAIGYVSDTGSHAGVKILRVE